MVPKPHSLRMHYETFRLGNHPSRHRKERDDAALLTQEGKFACAPSLFGIANRQYESSTFELDLELSTYFSHFEYPTP